MDFQVCYQHVFVQVVWKTSAATVFSGNILSIFPWTYLFIIGFIEEVNDLSRLSFGVYMVLWYI